ncbi:M42 family metallopeptidase [Verrucomicrobiaceae bacterium N1E253]|uniref:M42 family metallopeptidase n=1 Tax=Oceaniferula marina TaxID=2748318 RepID=A0A851GHF8_9BACT|nr:M42 family metallopeptidase [Oceaniferula marina]NWK54675.1 M42 family metallopeptidase [Oceaniferula marina]
MREKAIALLKELTEAHGAPGFEDEVRSIFAQELAGAGDLSTDGNGSVFCEQGELGPRVLLAGHMDEVAFRVQNITPDGFIQFVTLGGWWSHTLLAQRVEVRTRDGRKILGVVSSKPPHFLPESERQRVMPAEQMFIDVGAASRKELEASIGIRIGDPIVPLTPFSPMADEHLFMAKAFDNRVGMACAIQASQELKGVECPNTLIACGTVQEEVGVRGATTAAVQAQPDVCIVLEGTPADDTPGFNRSASQGMMGEGVQIRMQDPTAIMNPALVDLCVGVARDCGIRHQLALRSSGGTDARAFHLSGRGVPTIVLGVPSRYIHSHNSIIDIRDYLSMVELAVALIRKLDRATVDSLTDYL